MSCIVPSRKYIIRYHSMEGGEEDDERDADGLSYSYDTIIVGTGMMESILACAIQVLPNKKVLHFDPLDFYGRDLSTVTLHQMMEVVSSGGVSYASADDNKKCDYDTNADRYNDDSYGPLSSAIIKTESALCEFINGKGRIDENDDGAATLKASDLSCIDNHNSRSRSKEWLLRVASASKLPISSKTSPSSSSVVKVMYNKQNSHPSCFGYHMEKYEEGGISSIELGGIEATSSKTIHPSFFGYVTHNRMTLARAVYDGRNFSLDFSCKMLLSGGRMVESMINSDVGRYLEFKAIENQYILRPDTIWEVPCSKSDVFSTKLLSAIEKRILMKFLQFVRDWGQFDSGEEISTLNERELSIGAALSRPQNKTFNNSNFDVTGFENVPFRDFMNHYKIPQKLQDIIVYALCLETRPYHQQEDSYNLGTIEALRALSLHMNSLGRYGATAFLYPLYGVAEIAQAFCRMCAVWGGIYILRRGLSQFIVNKKTNRICAVKDDTGRVFGCKNVICNASDWHVDSSSSDQLVCTRISVCEGDSSFFPNSPRAFGVIPSSTQGLDNESAVHILQLNSSCNVCPNGSCLLYVTTTINTKSCSSSEDERALAESSMSTIINYMQKQSGYKEIFSVTTTKHLNDPDKIKSLDLPENVAICSEEKQSIHFQECVMKAKEIFHKLYPDEEFLPVGGIPSQSRGDVEEAEEVEQMMDELNRLQTSTSTTADFDEATIARSTKDESKNEEHDAT